MNIGVLVYVDHMFNGCLEWGIVWCCARCVFFHILYQLKSWNRSLSEGDEQVPAEKCSFENKPGPIGQPWSGIYARSTHSRAQSPHLYSEDDDNNACLRVSWGLREGVWDVGPPAAFLDCCSSPAPRDKSTHIPPSHSSESLKCFPLCWFWLSPPHTPCTLDMAWVLGESLRDTPLASWPHTVDPWLSCLLDFFRVFSSSNLLSSVPTFSCSALCYDVLWWDSLSLHLTLESKFINCRSLAKVLWLSFLTFQVVC